MHCCVHKIIRFSHQQDPRGNPTNIEWHDNIRRMQREDILYQFVSFPLFFCHQEWYWYSVTRDNIISISPASDLYSQMTLQWGRSKKKIRTETICRSLARGHKLQFTRETCNYSCNSTLTKDGIYHVSCPLHSATVIIWEPLTFLILR